MPQGVLPFQYAAERSSTGMTAMAGAGVYLDMMAGAGLWESVRRHVGIKGMSQGWTDIQMITSLVLLNVAGGESVSDLKVLEGDEGLGRLLRRMEAHGMRRREREAMDRRWRVERHRSVPSASAAFRYLERFHDAGEEARREPGRAFIPAQTAGLRGLNRVNAGERRHGCFCAAPHPAELCNAGPRIEYGAGYGCDAGRDAQAAGPVLLREVQSVPASDDPVWGYGAGFTGMRLA